MVSSVSSAFTKGSRRLPEIATWGQIFGGAPEHRNIIIIITFGETSFSVSQEDPGDRRGMGEWGRGNLHILTEIRKRLQKFPFLNISGEGIFIFFDYNNIFLVKSDKMTRCTTR